MNMLSRRMTRLVAVAGLFSFTSCSLFRGYQSSVTTDSYKSPYDDTTLTVANSTVLLPYNRFIDPAGTVVRFGKASQENHSLDCVLLPGGHTLAVEDRSGVAFIDVQSKKLLFHLDYDDGTKYKGLASTYSGIKALELDGRVHLFWGASSPSSKASYIMEAVWDGKKATIAAPIRFEAKTPAPMALPNDIALSKEGEEYYLYVVLNGNSELTKLRLKDRKVEWTTPTGMAPFGLALTSAKAYVSNWAGTTPTDSTKETAGIPYAKVYVDPQTGATASGTVSVIDLKTGKLIKEIETGLHPNAVITSRDQQFVYVANGNSDNVSVIGTTTDQVVETIPVRLDGEQSPFIGDAPNALAIDGSGTTLYVANGMDNAVAVVALGSKASAAGKGSTVLKGFIPTEAYPSGLVLTEHMLFVANLEGESARASTNKRYSSHQQEATVSIIPLPGKKELTAYTERVKKANLLYRTRLTQLLPRKDVAPRPVPERIGEPSVFKHVLYIIKENKTYDQVMGDMPQGDGMPSLCIYGDSITPNQHRLARQYQLLDNYYAAGKASAEGHSWADAAIVTDYIEKNVRAWFRSYPHVLADALAYNKKGFLWNNALDHGKSVRIYGEACIPRWDRRLGWKELYQMHQQHQPIEFTNETTISRVASVLCPTYPGYEGQNFNDQIRAEAFIKELMEYEKLPGDQLPQLMIMALPADHTAGMREGFPTPRAMVADNDLALGKIIEALSKSRFWDSTVVFVTEDDSQSGWDHVSGYRTTGMVISPYSRLGQTVHTNFNQTCMVRTIEQILGIPPMNMMDATALPMSDCFTDKIDRTPYKALSNRVPLDEMNKSVVEQKGQAKKYSMLSASPQFDGIDKGDDDLLNRILWFAAKGNKPYPVKMTLPKRERKDEDD